MSDKIFDINNFLKYFSKVYAQNPDLEITKDSIYFALSRYGVTQDKIKTSVENLFQNWIEKLNNENLKVFVNPNRSYFCQFVSPSLKGELENPIKMYLAVGLENLDYFIDKLFRFMADNNITHQSKVAKHLRSDGIVLRVYNKIDEEKIRNFINNSELKNMLNCTNPFLFHERDIGYALDGHLSFNATLASYIKEYLVEKRDTFTLSNVNYYDFLNYLERLYLEVFQKGTGIDKFYNTFCDNPKKLNKIVLLNNYEEVTSLIIKSMKSDELTEYFQEVETTNDHNSYVARLNNLSEIIEQNESNTLDPKYILDKYILVGVSKYGSIGLKRYLTRFMETGDYKCITRDEDLRKLFIENLTPDLVRKMLGDDLSLYIDQVINSFSNFEKKEYLDKAIITTYLKYHSKNQVINGIREAIGGNYKYFTNDNNARKNLKENVEPNEIAEIVYQYANSNFEEYVEMALEQVEERAR